MMRAFAFFGARPLNPRLSGGNGPPSCAQTNSRRVSAKPIKLPLWVKINQNPQHETLTIAHYEHRYILTVSLPITLPGSPSRRPSQRVRSMILRMLHSEAVSRDCSDVTSCRSGLSKEHADGGFIIPTGSRVCPCGLWSISS